MIPSLKIFREFKVIAIAVAITFVVFVIFILYVPVRIGDTESYEVRVDSGQSLYNVASSLNDRGLIRGEFIFVTYARFTGNAGKLKSGRYIFFKSENMSKILDTLVNGRSESDDLEITIPEGLNVWEIDKILVKAGLIGEGQFSSRYHGDEGYLFPDSYRLTRGSALIDKEYDVVQELREKMRLNFSDKTESLLSSLSPERQKEVVKIASILEKEAKTEEDMKLVAGIISKRIELGLPLQIDATVLYGACLRESIKIKFKKDCDVTFYGPAVEIQVDTPFNSYIHNGLPPAPISNPGIVAIRSALNPQKSDYLYYLSTRDGSQMIYSKTSAEHIANRKKYLGF